MKRLEGAESVRVSLKEKTVEVRLKPGAAFEPKRFRDAIASAGYKVGEIVLGIQGSLEKRGPNLTIVPAGARQVFVVTGRPPTGAEPGERAQMRAKLVDESKVPMTVELKEVRPIAP